jgi:hypothetical protein
MPVDETLVRELAGGGFLAHQRNLVLVGGTGSRAGDGSVAARDLVLAEGRPLARKEAFRVSGAGRGRNARSSLDTLRRNQDCRKRRTCCSCSTSSSICRR